MARRGRRRGRRRRSARKGPPIPLIWVFGIVILGFFIWALLSSQDQATIISKDTRVSAVVAEVIAPTDVQGPEQYWLEWRFEDEIYHERFLPPLILELAEIAWPHPIFSFSFGDTVEMYIDPDSPAAYALPRAYRLSRQATIFLGGIAGACFAAGILQYAAAVRRYRRQKMLVGPQ